MSKHSVGAIKNVILVASGKGGVGKSTCSTLLARFLAKKGMKVGVLDADIHGPSIGHIEHLSKPTQMQGDLVSPPTANGIKYISASMFTNDTAQILRGPMAGKFVQQFLYQVDWGPLDYLIIDCPPGTGDILISLGQSITIDGAILVTTPQKISAIDVAKTIQTLQTLNIPIFGLIESMSYFVCSGCDQQHRVFPGQGASFLAEKYNLSILGRIPLDETLSQWIDDESTHRNLPEQSSAVKAYNQAFSTLSDKLKDKKASFIPGAMTSFELSWGDELDLDK